MAVSRRWVHHNNRWRLMNLSESDPRFKGSVEYDTSADNNGRPDDRLTGRDVAAGRSVEDVEREQEEMRQAKQQQEAEAAAAAEAEGEGDDQGDGSVRTAARTPAKKTTRKATRPGENV